MLAVSGYFVGLRQTTSSLSMTRPVEVVKPESRQDLTGVTDAPVAVQYIDQDWSAHGVNAAWRTSFSEFTQKPAPAAEVAAAPWVPGRRCSIGFDQSFVTAAGEVVPCCFSDEHMGRLDEGSFDEIWNGARYASFRRRLIRGDFASYCIANRCSLPGVIQK